MLNKFVAGILSVACSAPVWADVVVQTPEQLVVVAINDQEIRTSLLGGRNNSYKLDAGNHQIAVKYHELFEDNYINHDIVRSNVVTLTTGDLKDGQTYQLVLLDPPKDYQAAKAFAEKPVIGLKDAQGNIIAKQEGASTKAKPWFGSQLFGNSSVDLTAKPVANPPVVKTQTNQVVAPVTTNAVVAVQQVNSNASVTAKEQQLIDLWKSATPQERQKFMAWLAEQASK